MANKIGPINQHDYLHPHYGPSDCCLCKAEERIKELEKRIAILEAYDKKEECDPPSHTDPKYLDYILEPIWKIWTYTMDPNPNKEPIMFTDKIEETLRRAGRIK